MNAGLKYTLWTLLWCAVVGYVVYAAMLSRSVRQELRVKRVEIDLRDSSATGYLLTAERILRWIDQEQIPTVGEPVDRVPISRIEERIARDGFAEKVVAYIDPEGVLHIRVEQRNPVFRLLADGRDCYVTQDGYVFDAPRGTSVYVPVVTGDYRPPFARDFSGRVRSSINQEQARMTDEIWQLERSKSPRYEGIERFGDSMRAERRRFIKPRWWMLETDDDPEFLERVHDLRQEKKLNLRRFRYMRDRYRDTIRQISREQQSRREGQKKLEKYYEDFINLLTFVGKVEKDAFWRSEVVQIVAHSTPAGALEVDLVPRSGRFIIRFGQLERIENKLLKLRRFYHSGLARAGWDTYRTIDVRYENQVICNRK